MMPQCMDCLCMSKTKRFHGFNCVYSVCTILKRKSCHFDDYFYHWLHRKFSKCQISVQLVVKISSKWWLEFLFQVNWCRGHFLARPWRWESWWRHQMETFSALLALCERIHRGPVNSPHKGQWREALMFSLICAWINGWVNNGETGDLRRYRDHYDVIVMI